MFISSQLESSHISLQIYKVLLGKTRRHMCRPNCRKNRVVTLLVHPAEEIILCVCVYIHVSHMCWFPEMPEESLRQPDTGVKGNDELVAM